MHQNKKSVKKQYKLPKEQLRYKGMLGGEITDGLGFGTLEQAKDWLENKFVPWNQEEMEMKREQIIKSKQKVKR